MGCWACGRELHEECPKIKPEIQDNSKGPADSESSLPVDRIDNKCCCLQKNTLEVTSTRSTGGYKADDEIGVSAGRKRAAVLHQIDPIRACEWRWKKNCGGGKYPIVGCLGGSQQHRHHGPVKNTARNESNNVHLICTNCHNRWHTLNDEDYDEQINNTLPHKPVPATLEECSQNEIEWKSKKVKTAPKEA